ncbi:MAG: hypothetical protein ABSH20_21955 [Tepidisphaeraceae bacterium]|jgi:hypothetical protein
MKLMGIVVGLFALLMFVGTSYAAKAPKDVATGKITAVDATAKTVTIQPRAAKGSTDTPAPITLTVDANTTKITVDGVDAKFEDLKEGMNVKASPSTDKGTATKIDAKSKAAKKAN